MFDWTEFQFLLFGKLMVVAIIPILLALVLLGLVIVVPITTSAQEPLPPDQISPQANIPWNIYIYASPNSNGTGLCAFTGKTDDICKNAQVTFTADPGVPTVIKGPYKSDEGIYSGCIGSGLFPSDTDTKEAFLDVRCELDNGDILVANSPIPFRRYYYENTQPTDTHILSIDNVAELTLSKNSLNEDHYIIVMNTNALPSGLPVGVKDIGLSAYSFSASGLIFETNNMVPLNLFYNEAFLDGVDPLTLRIFEWDAPNDTWADAGSQSLSAPVIGFPNMNKPTKKFTTYILGSTPRWCDSFTSGVGLETRNGISRTGGTLKLEDTATIGTATSKPYTPTLPLRAWQSISYTTANTSAGRSLSVSVLSQDNQVLKANVHSGQSLSGLLHPSLKLQVEMSTTSPGNSPQLLEWCLLADVTDEVYLPIVIKG